MGLVGGAVALNGHRARGRNDDAPKGRIFFDGRLENKEDDPRCIYALNLGTGQWDRVVQHAGWVRVSSDGKAIAYPKFKPSGREGDGVWVGDSRGIEEPRRVVDFNGTVFWSPDGHELIVSGLEPRGDPNEIRFQSWRMKSDGSDRVRLRVPADEQVRDWSPDGRLLLTAKLIAPKAAGMRRSVNVYTRKADGSDPRLLTEGTEYVTHRFAPDSRRVSFAREEAESKDLGGYSYSLWMAEAGGGEPRRVIRGSVDLSAFFSCWSPDGRWLAVDLIEPTRDEAGKVTGTVRHFEIMDADGGHRRKVELPHTDPVPLDWRF
jgi:Tol biopolymer transport system component